MTSICEKLKDFKSLPTENRPQIVLEILENMEIRASVCEIFTTRWSEVASSSGAVLPIFRIRLNERWGILAEEWPINKECENCLGEFLAG